MLPRAQAEPILGELGLEPGNSGVVTLHRPANVDAPAALAKLVDLLVRVSGQTPLVFAVHPRTQERLARFGLAERLAAAPGVRVLGPQGYLPFLCLTSQARYVITDSGGLQEETTALEVPCLTMRPNTERPITVTAGTSTLCGEDHAAVEWHLAAILGGTYKRGSCPDLWDGNAAERIAMRLVAG